VRHRIGLAVACLHISAVIYVLVGLFLLFMSRAELQGPALLFAVGLGVFWLALIVGIEVVAAGLNRRKFWAWIAGLCIFGMYTPSLFLPLGALGLWGLLDRGSRAEFGMRDSGSRADSNLAGTPPTS
jgi:hypothetical protein